MMDLSGEAWGVLSLDGDEREPHRDPNLHCADDSGETDHVASVFGFPQNPKAKREFSSNEATVYLKHTDKYVSGGKAEVLVFLLLTGKEKSQSIQSPSSCWPCR